MNESNFTEYDTCSIFTGKRWDQPIDSTYPRLYSLITVLFAAIVALFYAPVLVALYRISLQNATFIIFLSQGIVDFTMLFIGNYRYAIHAYTGQDELLCESVSKIINHAPWMLTLAHMLLIAVNRGYSMHFPLSYTRVWTKTFCLMSVLCCWAVSAATIAVVVASTLITGSYVLLAKIYIYYVWVSIYGAVAIYLSVIVRSAVEKCVKCFFNRPATTTSVHVEKGRVRIFIYCFATFMPLVLFYGIPGLVGIMDVSGKSGRFRSALLAVNASLLSSALLYCMSSMVRDNTHVIPYLLRCGCVRRRSMVEESNAGRANMDESCMVTHVYTPGEGDEHTKGESRV